MAHAFDPGYTRRFATLVRNYPGPEVYPPKDFRVEWGPIFHRGRLNGTARVLVLGQDPATHESIARRSLVGEAGQRVQGFLAKLGIDRSYVMVNTFLYSVFGQGGGERHKDNPDIAAYRNRWLDALLVDSQVEAVVALGRLADIAFQAWKDTPAGSATDVAFRAITHPTFPESASAAGQFTRAEAVTRMLANWNEALPELKAAIAHPDVDRPLQLYGDILLPEDRAPIPEQDLPAGVPPWMRAVESWAVRKNVDEADGATATPVEIANAKRATIVVKIPRAHRDWPDID
jgi:Uracil DNA glycosylase superfamily